MMEEDTSNSQPDWPTVKQEHHKTIDAPLAVEIGDIEALGDTPFVDSSPRTPTSANRISISELIRTLTQPTVGLFPHGVAPKELFDFMCKLPEDQRASKSRNHLQVLLWRDVKLGKISRVGVGVYTVPEFLEQITSLNPSKAGQTNSSSATTKCQLGDTSVVSTTSRTSPSLSTMTKEEQDTVAWQIINDTIFQSTKLVEKTPPSSAGKRKKKKSIKVDNRENSPQQVSPGDSSEKSENGIVSSTTPATEGSEPRPKRKRVKKQNFSADLSASLDDIEPTCFFCKMSGSENIFGHPESFICCKDCQFKAHPSCLGYDKQLTDKCRSYQWQCFDCKMCSCCLTAENAESMLMCDSCDRGYHMQCHTPVINDKPLKSDKWICSDCLKEVHKKLLVGTPQKKKSKTLPNAVTVDGNKRQIEIKNTVESICGTDSAKINAQLDKFTLPFIDDNPLIKKAATEAKIWSVEQVYNFISELGFPEQANAFKREEIDGQALLLLKRNDVLSMLSLKLGPALKIHRRLSILQSLAGGCNENEPEDH